MKKLLFSLAIGLGLIASTLPINAYASYPSLYEEDDFCGRYNFGCTAIVTKCRFYGFDACAIFEQIPCEELCPWWTH